MANIPVSTAIDNLLKSTPSTTVTTVAALKVLGATTAGDASIIAADLAPNAVTEAKILDGAVTVGKIGALAVTDAKLAANAVTTAKILDANVTLAKITGLGTAATAASTDFADDGGVFYAARYGVTADGTTNDTVALQAAIDAASATATPSARATVVLPTGLIRLSRTVQTGIGEDKQAINLKSNVNIVGQGLGSTTLKLLDNIVADTPTLLAYGVTKTNSTTFSSSPTVTVSSTAQLLVGMSATGSGIPADTFISALVNGTTITLSKNATASSSVVSIAFDHANINISNLTIDGNAITRGVDGGSEDEGLNFKQVINVLVSNCRFTNCGQDGIDLDAGLDIKIISCIFEKNFGNGIHAVGGGPRRVQIIGCSFIGNGFQRRAATGLAGSGSGLDTLATELVVDGCIFKDNSVEIQALAGHVTITNTQINHGGNGGPTGALTTTLSAVVAGVNEGSAATDASMTIIGCRIVTSVGSAIEVVNTFPLLQVIGNRINGSTTATLAGRVIFNNNYQTGTYGLHLVSTTKSATVCGNLFDVGYANGLRIEASTNGLAQGNYFFATDAGATDVALRIGSTGWNLIGNKFSSVTTGVASISGGGGGVSILGNTGDFKLSLGASTATVKGNQLGAVTWAGNGATGNLFEENTITSITNSGTVTFASNTWRRNTGAGCVGIFFGTVPLVSGTATVTTAAANSSRKWSLNRQAPNASTAIGNLALGTVTAQTSFVVNALSDIAIVATGDLSSVYWEILE